MEQKKEDIFDRLMHLPGLRIFEKFYKKNKEVLLYLLFGGLTTIVSIGTFAWFNVGMHMNELIANVISWPFVSGAIIPPRCMKNTLGIFILQRSYGKIKSLCDREYALSYKQV